ncbi:UNVERIFIED_CONTAM: hypothetical protein K2H54_028488 [Gekko kuhli]
METLSICVRLCEQGINPEALSAVIKELRKATEALKALSFCRHFRRHQAAFLQGALVRQKCQPQRKRAPQQRASDTGDPFFSDDRERVAEALRKSIGNRIDCVSV